LCILEDPYRSIRVLFHPFKANKACSDVPSWEIQEEMMSFDACAALMKESDTSSKVVSAGRSPSFRTISLSSNAQHRGGRRMVMPDGRNFSRSAMYRSATFCCSEAESSVESSL
jgi:hypothetical protein